MSKFNYKKIYDYENESDVLLNSKRGNEILAEYGKNLILKHGSGFNLKQFVYKLLEIDDRVNELEGLPDYNSCDELLYTVIDEFKDKDTDKIIIKDEKIGDYGIAENLTILLKDQTFNFKIKDNNDNRILGNGIYNFDNDRLNLNINYTQLIRYISEIKEKKSIEELWDNRIET